MDNPVELQSLQRRQQTAELSVTEAPNAPPQAPVLPFVSPVELQTLEQTQPPPPVGPEIVRSQRAPTDATIVDEDIQPPKQFKMTRQRLYLTLLPFAFGLAKLILSYLGDSMVPTVLEFAYGSVILVTVYLFGLYKKVRPKRFKYFLHQSLTWLDVVIETILFFNLGWFIYCYVNIVQDPCEYNGNPTRSTLYACFCISFPLTVFYLSGWISGMSEEQQTRHDPWDKIGAPYPLCAFHLLAALRNPLGHLGSIAKCAGISIAMAVIYDRYSQQLHRTRGLSNAVFFFTWIWGMYIIAHAVSRIQM